MYTQSPCSGTILGVSCRGDCKGKKNTRMAWSVTNCRALQLLLRVAEMTVPHWIWNRVCILRVRSEIGYGKSYNHLVWNRVRTGICILPPTAVALTQILRTYAWKSSCTQNHGSDAYSARKKRDSVSNKTWCKRSRNIREYVKGKRTLFAKNILFRWT